MILLHYGMWAKSARTMRIHSYKRVPYFPDLCRNNHKVPQSPAHAHFASAGLYIVYRRSMMYTEITTTKLEILRLLHLLYILVQSSLYTVKSQKATYVVVIFNIVMNKEKLQKKSLKTGSTIRRFIWCRSGSMPLRVLKYLPNERLSLTENIWTLPVHYIWGWCQQELAGMQALSILETNCSMGIPSHLE